jgi:hypothetical protein
MNLLRAKESTVILAFEKRLTQDEIDKAIMGMSPLSFHALCQSIDDGRRYYENSAAIQCGSNNAMGAAREIGAAEACANIIETLSSKRKPTE